MKRLGLSLVVGLVLMGCNSGEQDAAHRGGDVVDRGHGEDVDRPGGVWDGHGARA